MSSDLINFFLNIFKFIQQLQTLGFARIMIAASGIYSYVWSDAGIAREIKFQIELTGIVISGIILSKVIAF
jgi:hypothetical protein